MSEHTPGPWSVSNGDLLRITTTRKRPVVVCGVHRIGRLGGFQDGNPLANAHLIAAAPDLYAALQDALWAIDDLTDKGDAMTRGLAALSKAKG